MSKKYSVCEKLFALIEKDMGHLGHSLTAKEKKNIIDSCKKSFYNDKNCSGTIFEKSNRTDDEIIEDLMKNSLKNNDSLKNKKTYDLTKQILYNMRKNITSKKDYLSEDGFYKGLSEKDKEQLKNYGAISGCVIFNPLKSLSDENVKKAALKIMKKSKPTRTKTRTTGTRKSSKK